MNKNILQALIPLIIIFLILIIFSLSFAYIMIEMDVDNCVTLAEKNNWVYSVEGSFFNNGKDCYIYMTDGSRISYDDLILATTPYVVVTPQKKG